MNPVKALQDHGQAVWLDFLSRGFIADGGLKKLVDDDGLRGVTSNPSIFENAIGRTNEYDDAIRQMLQSHDYSPGQVFEKLAVEDIRSATDVLRPVFDATHGADGFVSIEVSPFLATDTQGTIEEAKRLWREVNRKNLMIKVPATSDGLPAIHDLTADGINVNITLLFAQQVYEQVVEAYLTGLEALAAKGGEISRIASVASFFVSRIDTEVDKLLDEKIARASRRSKARSQSPMPSSPTSAICGCSRASAGTRLRRTARNRSGSYGPRRGPRTKPTATSFMSRSLLGLTRSTPCLWRRSTHSAITASCATRSRQTSPKRSASSANSTAPVSRCKRSPIN
jgi:transaldolase